jgi:hypothetical protein
VRQTLTMVELSGLARYANCWGLGGCVRMKDGLRGCTSSSRQPDENQGSRLDSYLSMGG